MTASSPVCPRAYGVQVDVVHARMKLRETRLVVLEEVHKLEKREPGVGCCTYIVANSIPDIVRHLGRISTFHVNAHPVEAILINPSPHLISTRSEKKFTLPNQACVPIQI